MTCPKCDGLMVQDMEVVFTAMHEVWWACLICGKRERIITRREVVERTSPDADAWREQAWHAKQIKAKAIKAAWLARNGDRRKIYVARQRERRRLKRLEAKGVTA